MYPITRHLFFGIICFLPSIASCQQVSIALGEEIATASTRLQNIGGIDISSGMEIISPLNSAPPKGVYWELKAYKSVIELSTVHGKIVAICYWQSRDFSENKLHREDSRIYAESIAFNVKDRTISLIQLIGYDLYGWSTDSRNWNFTLLDYSINRNRTLDEIQNPESVLFGLDKLENQMSKLPPRTVVLLSPMPNSAHSQDPYPPKAIIEELRHYAASRGISFRTWDATSGRY